MISSLKFACNTDLGPKKKVQYSIKENFCTAKIAKSANYAGSLCLFVFFRKIDENYANPIYQSLRENACDATRLNSLINSLTLFHNKIHDSHVCISLLRVKLEIKSVPDLQAKTLIIYAAYLHNYMILSVTSIEEFTRRRKQVIIKKYVRELYGQIADHPGGSNKVNFIKPFKLTGRPR